LQHNNFFLISTCNIITVAIKYFFGHKLLTFYRKAYRKIRMSDLLSVRIIELTFAFYMQISNFHFITLHLSNLNDKKLPSVIENYCPR